MQVSVIMEQMKRVLVCGTCNQDVIHGKLYFGGAAGGIALNLASFGVPCGILSVLGNDTFSKRYQKEFTKRHVDTSLLSFAPFPISRILVQTQENSENARIFQDFGIKDEFLKLSPDETLLNKFDFLHVVNTPRTLCDVLAQRFSGTMSYCPGSLLVRDPSSLSTSLLTTSHFIFCNEREYTILKRTQHLQSLFNTHLIALCRTNAEKGLTLFTKKGKKEFSAIKVGSIVDTTGAGDAVAVGFIKEIINGKSVENAVIEGLRLASLVIQKPGVLIE